MRKRGEAGGDVGLETPKRRDLQSKQVGLRNTDEGVHGIPTQDRLNIGSRVDQRGGSADVEEGEQGPIEIDAHRDEEHDPVAGLDPQIDEATRQLGDLCLQFREAESLVRRIDDRPVVGVWEVGDQVRHVRSFSKRA